MKCKLEPTSRTQPTTSFNKLADQCTGPPWRRMESNWGRPSCFPSSSRRGWSPGGSHGLPHPSQRNNCRIISGTDSNRTGASRGYAPCHEQDSNRGLSGLRGSAPCHATLDHYTTAASELKHISGRF
ncbi:hypothetical protein D9C73_027710 [Collichthys lucidus]|uniref:Uncharacterized protein n=1 Tax=Collichthys lucidus TaxID=240159 RepID=A0A4U5TUW5_COLLU|nr:hypothetical protein D9C73_027710 [Collichthys lucidus]